MPTIKPKPTLTPRSDLLEKTRKDFKAARSPAYGDALRLCRNLETELNSARLSSRDLYHRAFKGETKMVEQARRIAELEQRLRSCIDWMDDAVKDVLYPLAHENTELGKLAEGLGSTSVNILKQARETLEPSLKEDAPACQVPRPAVKQGGAA